MDRKKMDLIGMRFARLLVLEEAPRNKQGEIFWKCLCDCGIEKIIKGKSLRSHHTKSCGCLQREKTSETNGIDLAGQRFGRYLVLKKAGKNKRGAVQWKCRCDCGSIKIVAGADLRSNHTKSCGCLQKERASEANYNSNLTNEDRQDRRMYIEYREWRTMIFERDNYTCQCCGTKKSPFNVHHLESYRDNPELRTLLENGITLCEKCHREFHHQCGYGNNTKEQFEKFLLFVKKPFNKH